MSSTVIEPGADRPRIRPAHRVAIGLGLIVWLAVVAVALLAVQHGQRESREQLERRFATRADIAARFIRVYAAQVLARERAQAIAQLSGPSVARGDFEAAVTGGGYQAAVLVDRRGRLLQVNPPRPSPL